jgi:DNA polymerase-3 subunit gamma/tau
MTSSDERLSQPSTRRSAPESYLVVARRYRPQTFQELIGQEPIVRALTSAIETQRVGHAYLFTGARGVGKTSAARILAKALNCHTGPSVQPCCACDICRSISAGEDVDVLEIDGASNRGIDEIRLLRQNVNVRPSRARFKIYIIDEVHMLTKEAFNALLKTLEEPPPHVKFIFATTEPAKIPTTILSRCQRFDFAGVDATQIRQRLQQIAKAEGIEADEEALEILARRAEGSLRDSQSLLEQILSFGGDRITTDVVQSLLGIAPLSRIRDMASSVAAGNAAAALQELDDAIAGGCDAEQVVEQLLGYFRDIMVAAVGCDADQFRTLSRSEAGEIDNLARRMGVEKSLAAVQILQQTLGQFRATVQGRILVEASLVRLAHLDAIDDLPALIAELRCDGAPPERTTSAGHSATTGPQPPPAGGKKNGPITTPEALRPLPNGPAEATPTSCDNTMWSSRPWDDATATAAWREAVDRLGRSSELVADNAARCTRLAVGGPGRLVASFPAHYTSCKRFCEEPQQKAKLETSLAELVGRTIQIIFEIHADENDENRPASAPRNSLSRRQLQAEIGSRPFVQRAMELFDTGKIKIDPPADNAGRRSATSNH